MKYLEIFIVLFFLSVSSAKSQNGVIINYKKELADSIDIVLTTEKKIEKQKNSDKNYLLLRNKGIVKDTLWKSISGKIGYEYLQIKDLSFKNDSCTFLVSNAFGIELFINIKSKVLSKWQNSFNSFVLMDDDRGDIKVLALLNVSVLRCEYYSKSTEVYRFDTGEPRKFIETIIDGKPVLSEVKIIK